LRQTVAMKRKRNQIEEGFHNNNNINNESKKLRVSAPAPALVLDSSEITEADTSLEEEKKEEFVLTREIADSAVVTDIAGNKWRIGAPIGKGSFGEIFLASNDINRPVNVKTAHYVTKIEPHSNGPLFVEIHCLLNVNKQNQGRKRLIFSRHKVLAIKQFIFRT
jgi:hypothetical protein